METRKKEVNPYLKYQNTDPRCHYLFEPSPLFYCRVFANLIDGGRTQEQIIRELCREKPICYLWGENGKEKE